LGSVIGICLMLIVAFDALVVWWGRRLERVRPRGEDDI
jgi:hypothetical protein